MSETPPPYPHTYHDDPTTPERVAMEAALAAPPGPAARVRAMWAPRTSQGTEAEVRAVVPPEEA